MDEDSGDDEVSEMLYVLKFVVVKIDVCRILIWLMLILNGLIMMLRWIFMELSFC